MTSPLRRRLKRIPWLRTTVLQTLYLWECVRDRWLRDVADLTDHSHTIREWDFETPEVAERNQTIFTQMDRLQCSLKESRVFELGCADGVFTRELTKRGALVTAADVSAVGLDRARERCAGIPTIEFRRLNIERDAILQKETGPYDVIFAMDVLEFLHGRDLLHRAADSIADALKPGGLLVICSCRAKLEIRNAVWQPLFPEGGEAHIKLLSKRRDLTLLHAELHPPDGHDLHGYYAHVIGFFRRKERSRSSR